MSFKSKLIISFESRVSILETRENRRLRLTSRESVQRFSQVLSIEDRFDFRVNGVSILDSMLDSREDRVETVDAHLSCTVV